MTEYKNIPVSPKFFKVLMLDKIKMENADAQCYTWQSYLKTRLHL